MYASYRYENRISRKGHRFIAGVDESGRGPLAGPVVAAAVILENYKFRNRVDDSKILTPRQRLLAYDEILKHSTYSVAVIGHKIIDTINIYNATKLAMEKAVIGLSVRPDFLLIDGNIRLSLPYKSLSIKKGDRLSISIACASIIAKVHRDRIMEGLHRLYPEYGFMNHKGYGTVLHMTSLKKYGPSPVHRRSFEPIKGMLGFHMQSHVRIGY